MKLVSLLFLILLSSCGESPLFNHQMEKLSKVVKDDLSACPPELASLTQLNLEVSVHWQNCVPYKGEEKLRLYIWDASGTLYGPYSDVPDSLHIDIWMPSMGHGSVPVKINKIAPGIYDVTNIFFIMGGRWDLRIQNRKDGNTVDEIKFSYTL